MNGLHTLSAADKATVVHIRQQDKVIAFTHLSKDSDLGKEIRQRLSILEEETGVAD